MSELHYYKVIVNKQGRLVARHIFCHPHYGWEVVAWTARR